MGSKKIKVLLEAFECVPFMKTGGLADVAGTLPAYVNNDKFDVRVILPKLDVIPAEYTEKMEFICDFTVELSWRNAYCGLFRLKHKGVTYYFLDNEQYFKRGRVYGEYDDGERIAYYSKAVAEAVAYLPAFKPDIIHCNDWHTALTPVYLKEFYEGKKGYKNIKTIFTVHNLKFQGVYSDMMLGDPLGLYQTWSEPKLRFRPGDINFMKGALLCVDRITTVSPTYADEICTAEYGENLEGLFNEKREILSGILNGIDYDIWNPETDKCLPFGFNKDSLENKLKNKTNLQRELGLEADENIPVFAAVSRLTDQKGFDLLASLMPDISRRRMQVVILGVGEAEYEGIFKMYAAANPSMVSANIAFDDALSHKLYGCADAFLMPSRFEPCGLSQMMAMRYGTLPVVRETGGLKDTVVPYNYVTGEGTGFSFGRYSADDLLAAIDHALNVWYQDRDAWKKMAVQAMEKDFSWISSAEKYRELYAGLS